MIYANEEKIKAGTTPNFSGDSVRIKSGSFVVDNKWINFNGSIYKVTDYITTVLRGNRTRFFKDRNYSVYLLIGLDPIKGIRTIEGKHVKFTTIQAVPPPDTYDFIPVVGIILIQDGTRDLNYGYIPLRDEFVQFFSGYGNIINRDLKGVRGDDCSIFGETGLRGEIGTNGSMGSTGFFGATGSIGPTKEAPIGATGLRGVTGVNWGINIPFEEFL